MLIDIDLSSGNLRIKSGYIIKNDSFKKVIDSGFSAFRIIETNTGWKHCGVKNHNVCGHDLFLGMAFHNDLLQNITGETPQDLSGLKKFELHKKILSESIRDRKGQSGNGCFRFFFPWGAMSAELDPRTDRSVMLLSWS